MLLECTYELMHPSLNYAFTHADTLCFLLRTPEDAHGEEQDVDKKQPAKKRARGEASQKVPPRTAYYLLHGEFRMQWPGTDQFYSVLQPEFDPTVESDLLGRCVSGLVRFTPGGEMYELDVQDLLQKDIMKLCSKLCQEFGNLESRKKSALTKE